MFKPRQEVAKVDCGAQAHRGIKPAHNLHGYCFLIRWKMHLCKEHVEQTRSWEAKAWMKWQGLFPKGFIRINPGQATNKNNRKYLSWLLTWFWVFRNPARTRLETQPGLWIIDLEQPETDLLKGQDTLFAFSSCYNPHPDNITSAPSDLVSDIFLPSVLLSQVTSV